MKKIVIFYHAWLVNDWKKLIVEQVGNLVKSGLFDIAERLHIGFVGDSSLLKDLWKTLNLMSLEMSKITVENSAVNSFEYITLNALKNYCDKNDCYVFYFHTKGISKAEGSIERLEKDEWRKCLEYFNIECWKDCIKKLEEGYDTCGIDYRRRRSLYMGNFWWAKSDFIKRVPPPLTIDKVKKHGGPIGKRLYYEYWFRGTYNKYYSFYLGHDNDYRNISSPAKTGVYLTRIDVINKLIERFGYESYFEIGCLKKFWYIGFDHVAAKDKFAVSPLKWGWRKKIQTSDDFFSTNNKCFDLIFVDGIHKSDQAYRDILNALKFLKPNGTIVVHDCNPIGCYANQSLHRNEKMRNFNGEVWKAWTRLRSERDDLLMFVVDTDRGCGIIRRGEQRKSPPISNDILYQDFAKQKKEILNLKSITEFNDWLESF